MIREYTQEDLESFVKGFIKASKVLRSEKPDFLLAPITGAVPFIDTLALVDRKFHFDSVQYVPSTSKFDNLLELMEDWYTNFLESKYRGERIKIATVDEVVSGSSAVRAFDAFEKGKDNLAKILAREIGNKDTKSYEKFKKDLNKRLVYLSLGIFEQERNGAGSNRRYQRLISQKKIKQIPVKKIVTMDYPPLCPLKLKPSHKSKDQKRSFYKPEIGSFEVSGEYIGFLRDVARYVGVDPESVSPVNVSRMHNFRDFLSDRFKEENSE